MAGITQKDNSEVSCQAIDMVVEAVSSIGAHLHVFAKHSQAGAHDTIGGVGIEGLRAPS